jgi:RHS repeat-associated protein
MKIAKSINSNASYIGVFNNAFGMQLQNRHESVTDFRCGFQGQVVDNEVSGSGNSIDFGNRMYNPRLGKFLSLDAFASKYPAISPYAFVTNNPISNIEIGGDSVLFYSASGTYLGYSHDNVRYKDKNLLVIIKDKDVKNFKSQYERKRGAEYKKANELSASQVEQHVAGLEGMGTTFDVTEMQKFYNDNYNKVPDGEKTKTENDDTKQIEWGAHFEQSKNPVVSAKQNWMTIDQSTKQSGGRSQIFWNSRGKFGEIHIHTEYLRSSPSIDFDWVRQRLINKTNPDAFSVVIDGAGLTFFSSQNVETPDYNPVSFKVGKNSFKNAK